MTIKRATNLLVWVVLFAVFNGTSAETPHPTVKLAREIRKLFLDIKGIPPSIKELEFYTIYSQNGYEVALDDLLNVKEKNDRIYFIKEYYLSSDYKSLPSSKLNKREIDNIILYQSGLKEGPLIDAKLKIIKDSLAIESDSGDAIDYMAELLMGRLTNLDESNHLSKIRKKYSDEEQGLLAVLEEILTFKDCLYK
jgi:hypothetical protein